MNREAMIADVKRQMPERRWIHTQGVMDTAMLLAERFGANAEHAELAAILHDVAKYWPVDQMAAAIREEAKYSDILDYDKELWHAHAGAYVAERDYGVANTDVLNAIRYHTSGRVGMSLLEKVVWLADLIEPGREFPTVNKIREIAEHSLEQALVAGFDTTIVFLIEKRKRIYPLTIKARNDLI
ncbi:HD domain-containing protein [Paenibacillaceae bacterium]|nr:HD domain-containing protein [Paenibacillaceae bacterium]